MSDPNQRNGAEQVAAFLLTLDKDGAASVLRHLDPTVIVEVVEAMGDVDAAALAPDGVRELYKRIVLDLKRPGGVRRRSAHELKQMIEQTLGREQAGAVFETINKRLQQERPFLALEKEPLPRHLGRAGRAVRRGRGPGARAPRSLALGGTCSRASPLSAARRSCAAWRP
jgi:flagellar motor switch protein FliG